MSEKQVTRETGRPREFPEHYETVVHRVRAAFMELLLSVGADPARSRDVSRKFKLNKNLTWMVSKIVNSTDVYAIAQHIPGPARIDSLLTAMKKGGAPESAVDKLRSAIRGFDEMVDLHTGDRSTLEMMIAGMSPDDVRSEHLAHSRKLAFQGLSGILGGQARLRTIFYMMAPSEVDPTMVDLVEVAGLVGFRRLRTDVRWLIFRRQRWTDDGSEPTGLGETPLDPDYSAASGSVPLLGRFCSDPIPTLDAVPHGDEMHHELPQGPIGNTAAVTFVYGVVARKVGSAYRDERNRFCELGCSLTTPAESVLFDLLVHEDLPWSSDWETSVFSMIDGDPAHVALRRTRNKLPITESLQRLGRGIAPLMTPLMPEYGAMVQSAFESVGWDADRFHGFRLTMKYPPIPAMALIRQELPSDRNQLSANGIHPARRAQRMRRLPAVSAHAGADLRLSGPVTSIQLSAHEPAQQRPVRRENRSAIAAVGQDFELDHPGRGGPAERTPVAAVPGKADCDASICRKLIRAAATRADAGVRQVAERLPAGGLPPDSGDVAGRSDGVGIIRIGHVAEHDVAVIRDGHHRRGRGRITVDAQVGHDVELGVPQVATIRIAVLVPVGLPDDVASVRRHVARVAGKGDHLERHTDVRQRDRREQQRHRRENDPDTPSRDGLMLISRFCTTPLAELHCDGVAGATCFELPPGPVGNTAQMSWVRGWCSRAFASMYRDASNTVGEHPTRVFVPVETLVCDLHVHQSLSFAMNPAVALYGQLARGPMFPGGLREGDSLPITESVRDLGNGLRNVATPLIPNYVRMVEYVHERVGWNPREFSTFRVTIKYPPIPSVAILRVNLAERP